MIINRYLLGLMEQLKIFLSLHHILGANLPVKHFQLTDTRLTILNVLGLCSLQINKSNISELEKSTTVHVYKVKLHKSIKLLNLSPDVSSKNKFRRVSRFIWKPKETKLPEVHFPDCSQLRQQHSMIPAQPLKRSTTENLNHRKYSSKDEKWPYTR